jgi:hypothetical protein
METRWGRLFRSDTLHELTADDLAVLREVGLASIIDLRTVAEVERVGRGPLAREPVKYVHLSVLQEEAGESHAAAAPSGDDLSERYLWYLDVGRRAFVQAFELLADEASYPLVFHCTAGKDRTGVLTALLLDTLGVDRDVIVTDYIETAARLDLILERLRRDPVHGPAMDGYDPSVLGVEAVTMQRFLEGLHARHGGARGWLREAGMPDAALDRIAGFLLEKA